jgi:hypothetical protein
VVSHRSHLGLTRRRCGKSRRNAALPIVGAHHHPLLRPQTATSSHAPTGVPRQSRPARTASMLRRSQPKLPSAERHSPLLELAVEPSTNEHHHSSTLCLRSFSEPTSSSAAASPIGSFPEQPPPRPRDPVITLHQVAAAWRPKSSTTSLTSKSCRPGPTPSPSSYCGRRRSATRLHWRPHPSKVSRHASTRTADKTPHCLPVVSQPVQHLLRCPTLDASPPPEQHHPRAGAAPPGSSPASPDL